MYSHSRTFQEMKFQKFFRHWWRIKSQIAKIVILELLKWWNFKTSNLATMMRQTRFPRGERGPRRVSRPREAEKGRGGPRRAEKGRGGPRRAEEGRVWPRRAEKGQGGPRGPRKWGRVEGAKEVPYPHFSSFLQFFFVNYPLFSLFYIIFVFFIVPPP